VAAEVAHDPIAASLNARFLSALADRIGHEPSALDNLLVAPPLDDVPQHAIPVLAMAGTGTSHPRMDRALAHRRDVRG
jgi:hypothetical protein